MNNERMLVICKDILNQIYAQRDDRRFFICKDYKPSDHLAVTPEEIKEIVSVLAEYGEDSERVTKFYFGGAGSFFPAFSYCGVPGFLDVSAERYNRHKIKHIVDFCADRSNVVLSVGAILSNLNI